VQPGQNEPPLGNHALSGIGLESECRFAQSGRGRLIFFTQSQRDDGSKTISPHPPNGGRETAYNTSYRKQQRKKPKTRRRKFRW
jgi:hypothetical protein